MYLESLVFVVEADFVVEVLFEGVVVLSGIEGSVEEFDGDSAGDAEIDVSVAGNEFDVKDTVISERVRVPADSVGHTTGESVFAFFGEVEGLSGNCFHCIS